MGKALSIQGSGNNKKEGTLETETSTGSRGELVIFTLLFFLSGMCALIYEIAWTRRLTLIFGNTVYSVSTVLVAFMGGLALGSLLFGRLIDKRDNPIRIYGWLEIGIGVSAIVLPFALSALNPAYIFLSRYLGASNYILNLVRFVLSTTVLIVPTIMMGATLPVLSKFVVARISKRGLGIGSLYAINTFGAVIGCFLAGFILIGWIGVSSSEQMAAAINIGIGVAGLVLSRRLVKIPQDISQPTPAKATGTGDDYSQRVLRFVLIMFGISGMLALAYEVIWTRILIFLLGSSIYSFSIILVVYLSGLTVGSLISAGFVDRLKRPLQAFGWIEMLIGISVLFGLMHFLDLEFVDYSLSVAPKEYITKNFLSTFVIILPPTLLMGAAFPIAVRIYTRGLSSIGRQIGNLYAINTIGAVVGSFVAGFVLIPVIGSKNSMMLLVLLSLAVGFALLCLSVKWEKASSVNWLAGVLMVLPIAGIPFGNDMMEQLSLRFMKGIPARVIAIEEDATATVAVVEQRGSRGLSVNGVAMTALCTETQLMAHIPLALADNPQNFLNICFGMGSTFVSARRAGMSVDIVELCPFVLETFQYFQSDPSMMDEPGVRKIIADGRNYLLLSDKKYDVISIDPPPPTWSAGTVNLYTREFYELCKMRLKPGGIICQWFPTILDSLSEEQFRTLLRTFIDVFPHMSVWDSPFQVGTFVIGTPKKLRIDEESFGAYFDRRPIQEDLALYSYRGEIFDGEKVASLLVLEEEAAREYVRGAPVLTDDLPLTEFPLFRNGPGTRIMNNEFLQDFARRRRDNRSKPSSGGKKQETFHTD